MDTLDDSLAFGHHLISVLAVCGQSSSYFWENIICVSEAALVMC